MSYESKAETATLLTHAEQSLLHIAARPRIVMERGEGMYLWDTEGKQYLDFIGGWAVACLGHAPVAIRDDIRQRNRGRFSAFRHVDEIGVRPF